ncbi:MAG TPA: DUF1573 domain-containing protein [Sphingobacteriaceae bacterium]|nr:DUF1573 domain-containing protein [Sphingobacteriaceae bacterium]
MNTKLSTLVILAAAAVMVGCGGGASQDSSAAQDLSEMNQIQDAAEGTVSVVDDGGNESGIESTAGVSGQANLAVGADTYDFGVVTEGEVVEHTFVFTNSGDQPLILNQVSASCGCTTPEFSRTPISPGAEGNVKVVFDSNGQVGKQHKIITVANNGATPVVLLHLRGEVTAK